MSIRSILTPYSQKTVLHESFLPDCFDGVSASHLPFSINASIADYRYPQMNDFIDEILRDMDTLTRQLPSFYRNKGLRNINNQPTWCMNNPTDLIIEEIKTVDLENCCPDGNIDLLAYYLPAHNEMASIYGVHITHEGIAKLAKDIIKQCPTPHSVSDITLAALFKLYAHELTHGWIEDLVSLLDISTGEKRPINQRAYQKTNKQYSQYIYMEEAICNTASYGWLKHFLYGNTQENTLLDAFNQWMKAAPKGYSDFLEIETEPYQNSKFIENIFYLLKRIYKPNATNTSAWSDELITQTIELYFGCKVSYDYKCLISRPFFYKHCLWADNIPVHIEHYGALPVRRSELFLKNKLSNCVLEDENSIKSWLAEHDIYNYSIDDKLVVYVGQNVILSALCTPVIPVKFGKIDGDFYLHDCPNLESLKNSPTEVKGIFHVNNLPKMISITQDWEPVEIHSMYINCREIKSFRFLNGLKVTNAIVLDKINHFDNLINATLCKADKVVLRGCASIELETIMQTYLDKENRHEHIMDCVIALDGKFDSAAEL